MKNHLVKNKSTLLFDKKVENVSLLLINGKIAKSSISNIRFNADKKINTANLTIQPGFIDIHNHGAVGVDVNTASAEDLRKVSRFLATKGVTGWLPTFVPDAVENYRSVIEAIDEVMRTQDDDGREAAARVLGVHYEGVFANQKMCGALRPKFFRTFRKGNELNDLPTLQTPGAIHLTTLAPEVKGGVELVKELKKRNWIVSIGHTNADVETLERAFAAGARHVTHLFNAMTGVHHRDVGVAGWALMKDEIFCEIIADGVHVAAPMLKFALKNKGAGKLALVSDSVAPAGLGDGEFELWGEKISVVNGKTRNERGSIAGSVITMLDAVNMMRFIGVAPEEVSKMASLVPAEILGIDHEYGLIEVGKRADLVAIDERGRVKLTVVGGRVAFTGMSGQSD